MQALEQRLSIRAHLQSQLDSHSLVEGQRRRIVNQRMSRLVQPRVRGQVHRLSLTREANARKMKEERILLEQQARQVQERLLQRKLETRHASVDGAFERIANAMTCSFETRADKAASMSQHKMESELLERQRYEQGIAELHQIKTRLLQQVPVSRPVVGHGGA